LVVPLNTALPLIRKLVDHTVFFYTGGRDFGENSMTIIFSNGSKIVFPWYWTYGWSRDAGAGPALLVSALMALEAWSHSRIEAGEPIDKVISDVIGAANPSAAYLLVIVDMLLSHWPTSSVAAGKLWFAAHPDDKEFWIEHAVGRRLCSVIEAILALLTRRR
jgi:hypothetical protein